MPDRKPYVKHGRGIVSSSWHNIVALIEYTVGIPANKTAWVSESKLSKIKLTVQRWDT